MISAVFRVLRGCMPVQLAWLRICTGIVIVALAMTVVPSTGFGEQLSVAERALLEAVVASNAGAISEANAGEMDVKSTERYAGNTYVLDAHVIWDGSNILYDYKIQKSSRGSGSAVDRAGMLLDTPKVVVDFHRSSNKAFRAIDRCKTYDGVFLVTPAASWFSYNLEFPLREVLTADETWDYGSRTVSVERTDSTVTMLLRDSEGTGKFEATFSTDHDGLIQTVVHTDEKGPRYRAEYQWAKSADVWYPKHLRMFSRVSGYDFSEPRFELTISNFVPRLQIQKQVFSEDRLGINPATELVTYRKGVATIVRKPKPVPLPEQLKQLGEAISRDGFASPDR